MMWNINTQSIILLGLATWRLSKLLTGEAGPFKVFTRIRAKAGITHDEFGLPLSAPESFFGELLNCVYCCSVWVSTALVAVLYFFPQVFLLIALPLSGSTIAIWLDERNA